MLSLPIAPQPEHLAAGHLQHFMQVWHLAQAMWVSMPHASQWTAGHLSHLAQAMSFMHIVPAWHWAPHLEHLTMGHLSQCGHAWQIEHASLDFISMAQPVHFIEAAPPPLDSQLVKTAARANVNARMAMCFIHSFPKWF